MSPENQWLVQMYVLLKWSLLRGHVSFQGCTFTAIRWTYIAVGTRCKFNNSQYHKFRPNVGKYVNICKYTIHGCYAWFGPTRMTTQFVKNNSLKNLRASNRKTISAPIFLLGRCAPKLIKRTIKCHTFNINVQVLLSGKVEIRKPTWQLKISKLHPWKLTWQQNLTLNRRYISNGWFSIVMLVVGGVKSLNYSSPKPTGPRSVENQWKSP